MPEPKPVLSLECQRLIDDDYDQSLYPNDECRCIYIIYGEPGVQSSYTFSHKWTPLQYQMYLDSILCGYKVVNYGNFDVIRTNVTIGDATLECDC